MQRHGSGVRGAGLGDRPSSARRAAPELLRLLARPGLALTATWETRHRSAELGQPSWEARVGRWPATLLGRAHGRSARRNRNGSGVREESTPSSPPADRFFPLYGLFFSLLFFSTVAAGRRGHWDLLTGGVTHGPRHRPCGSPSVWDPVHPRRAPPGPRGAQTRPSARGQRGTERCASISAKRSQRRCSPSLSLPPLPSPSPWV